MPQYRYDYAARRVEDVTPLEVSLDTKFSIFSDLDFTVGPGTDVTYQLIIGLVLRSINESSRNRVQDAAFIPGLKVTDDIEKLAKNLVDFASGLDKPINALTDDEIREALFNPHPDVNGILHATNLELGHDTLLVGGFDHIDRMPELKERGNYVKAALSFFDRRGIYTSVSTKRGERVISDMGLERGFFSPIVSEEIVPGARNSEDGLTRLVSFLRQTWYSDSSVPGIIVYTDDNRKHIQIAKRAKKLMPSLHPYHVHELARPYELRGCQQLVGTPDQIHCIEELRDLRTLYARKAVPQGIRPRAVDPAP